jgi:hypothetical protein
MALQTLNGWSLPFPSIQANVFNEIQYIAMLLDATGEKSAFIGRVFFEGRSSTKAIERIGFRFGSVTKSGGSGLTVSLQDVLTTAGPPGAPDETQDQTVAIANGNASFASNTWIRTGTLSANRTVAPGDRLAVVVEFDGSGRLGSDVVNVMGLYESSGGAGGTPFCSHKTGGAWGAVIARPNVILEFSDGTFGTLYGSHPTSAIGTLSYALNTAGADEYGLVFTVPFKCKVDGAWWLGSHTCDAEVLLYEGTTVLGTITLDENIAGTVSSRVHNDAFAAPIELTPGTTYRIALRPTSNTGLSLKYVDVNAAGHFDAWEGGQELAMTSRLNQGAWAATTTTSRPLMGVLISALDDGVSAGGGGLNLYAVE